jgi:hypothetical protein
VTLQTNASKSAKFLAILDEEATRVRMRTAASRTPFATERATGFFGGTARR